ncbi:hypothetical protein [Pseudomonas juntendi]|uniref:Uncharacterized protein n=1 Tax=Pseudomonas juntendi TaxID=2666183 RepID=A0AAJ5V1C2_9PSED|nr:hypothetical protein [Pseudomonas juntendi]WEA22923.1 hypothetical protein PWA60_12280 [Pseudomonas juntendi]
MLITLCSPAQKLSRCSGTPGSVFSQHNGRNWVSFRSAATVKGSIDKTIDTLFAALATAMLETIEKPLEESVKQFFDELKLAVESLRSDLAQSIRDKQTSQEQQKALAERLAEFKRQVPGLQQDSAALKRDVQPQESEVMA